MTSKENKKEANIASVVLAGGKGARLFPLTINHSKPAISFGGRYRLIDIPISNSLNSNIRQIFVLGQYLTAELQHHLSQTYQFDSFLPGRLDFLTPEELPNGSRIWFDGTADAVRKSLNQILKVDTDYYLILSGDQLYNINFQKMFEFAQEKDADLTIASIPVRESEAKRLGLLQVNDDAFVTNFVEKPKEEKVLKEFQLPSSFYKNWNVTNKNLKYLGSMGIYIFKREALISLLKEDPREDFGKHLIPTEIKKGSTASYIYDGYWEDIGTIESYYTANIELTQELTKARLNTYDEKNPIYSRTNHLPGTKLINASIKDSIISEGGLIKAASIENSIIGLRSHIKNDTFIKDSIVMGNSFYHPSRHHLVSLPDHFEIGKNCIIEKSIIDEHVLIGNNVKLINKKNIQNFDSENLYVRDGIIIITAGAKIPNNFEF
jgi:glucose-1-phosphate adenylyltransferase